MTTPAIDQPRIVGLQERRLGGTLLRTAEASGAGGVTPEALSKTLATLERRVGLLEDVAQLERLNSIYGYYLAHLQWDDLTGIFSPTGSIEIAMRGVYSGMRAMPRAGLANPLHRGRSS